MTRRGAAWAVLAAILVAAVVAWFAMSQHDAAPSESGRDVASSPPGPDAAAPVPTTKADRRQRPHAAAEPTKQRAVVRVVRRGADISREVAGAAITVTFADGSSRTLTTGPDGSVVFEDAPAGACDIALAAPGFLSRTARDRIDAAFDVTFALDPSGALAGRVVDAATGAPVAGAEVVVSGRDQPGLPLCPDHGPLVQRFDAVRSGVDGGFRTSSVPALRRVWIVARTSDGRWGRTYASAEAEGAAPAEVVVRVEPCGALAGRIVDARGSAVPGAVVLAACIDDAEIVERLRGGWIPPPGLGVPELLATQADGDGVYRLDGLRAGREHVAIAMDAAEVELGRPTARGETSPSQGAPSEPHEGLVCDAAGDTISADFALGAYGAVVVRVLGPVDPECTVIVLVGRAIEVAEPAEGFRLARAEGVAPGRRVVTVMVPGFACERRTVDVAAGGETTLEVRLLPAAELVVRVLDAEGHGIEGAKVAVRRSDGSEGTETASTNSDGAGTFQNLATIAHRVEVDADGFAPAVAEATPGGAGATIVLRRGGVVRGSLRGAEKIEFRGIVTRHVETDADGSYEIRLPPGWFDVTLPDGRALARTEVSEGATTVLDLSSD